MEGRPAHTSDVVASSVVASYATTDAGSSPGEGDPSANETLHILRAAHQFSAVETNTEARAGAAAAAAAAVDAAARAAAHAAVDRCAASMHSLSEDGASHSASSGVVAVPLGNAMCGNGSAGSNLWAQRTYSRDRRLSREDAAAASRDESLPTERSAALLLLSSSRDSRAYGTDMDGWDEDFDEDSMAGGYPITRGLSDASAEPGSSSSREGGRSAGPMHSHSHRVMPPPLPPPSGIGEGPLALDPCDLRSLQRKLVPADFAYPLPRLHLLDQLPYHQLRFHLTQSHLSQQQQLQLQQEHQQQHEQQQPPTAGAAAAWMHPPVSAHSTTPKQVPTPSRLRPPEACLGDSGERGSGRVGGGREGGGGLASLLSASREASRGSAAASLLLSASRQASRGGGLASRGGGEAPTGDRSRSPAAADSWRGEACNGNGGAGSAAMYSAAAAQPIDLDCPALHAAALTAFARQASHSFGGRIEDGSEAHPSHACAVEV